jgi:uncharacterized membrane protein
MRDRALARALGAFSLGLGAIQIAAPRRFIEWCSLPRGSERETVTRVVGAREVVAGIGLVSRPVPAVWAGSRVLGDLMDIALLLVGLRTRGARRGRIGALIAAVAGILVVDLTTTVALAGKWKPGAKEGDDLGSVGIETTITVERPREEVYRFWRDLENLPRFMANLESVDVQSERVSHWKAKAPVGTSAEWDAEIVDDRPNELIEWRSLAGADVGNAGRVRFLPTPMGATEVRVEMEVAPPGGVLGALAAKVLREEPSEQVRGDLRRFKQVMETGEVVRSDATADGTTGLKQPPAQPSAEHDAD